MKRFTIYAPNTRILDTVIREITDAIPSFVEFEPVEMDFLKVEVTCREEDTDFVLRELTAITLLS
jgi:hypothetical protein